MTASPPTHPSGENVSDVEANEQLLAELLHWQLQRCAETLNSELWRAVADSRQGDLDRENYEVLVEATNDLADVLEFVDRYTYEPRGAADSE